MSEILATLDAVAMRNRLREEIGLPGAERFDLRFVAETGSTNDDVAGFGAGGEAEGLVLFAESQTAGRGRRGDAWVSPPGVNLLFSLLLRPEPAIAKWVRIPHLAGVAIARGIESAVPDLPEPVQLKWPNDLYLGGKKTGGILIESRSAGREGEAPFAVLGAGLNINLPVESLPNELHPIATSLRECCGRILDRNALAASILAEWAAIYPASLANFDSIRAELEQRSLLLGKRVRVQTESGEVSGLVRDFGPDGELLISEPEADEPRVVRSADSVRMVE